MKNLLCKISILIFILFNWDVSLASGKAVLSKTTIPSVPDDLADLTLTENDEKKLIKLINTKVNLKDPISVKFDYTEPTAEREIAYRFYKNNYKYFAKENPLERDQIGIFLYDLNQDGKKEILVYIHNTACCGVEGCKFDILKLDDKGEYTSMKLEAQTIENIKILKSSHLKYHDLLLYDKVWRWHWHNYGEFKTIKVKDKLVFKNKNFEKTTDFYKDLAMYVSSNKTDAKRLEGYFGAYLMNIDTLIDTGYIDKITKKWTGKNGMNSEKDFLKNPIIQGIAAVEYHDLVWDVYLKDYHKYEGKNIGGIEITKSGMIGAAHGVGHGELKKTIDLQRAKQ